MTTMLHDPSQTQERRPPGKISFALDTLRLVFQEGGPGFVQFALNNACNANCGFCGFALDKLPKSTWHFVSKEDGINSIDILYKTGMRFLVFSGGEPTLNRNLVDFVRHANNIGMKVMVVTNGGLLKAEMVDELVEAGLSSLIISIDAASEEVHEKNRGLPGVCKRIREANAALARHRMDSTASVTMSKLVDYDALPDFLTSLGFRSVVFSYPLTRLDSNFLGASEEGLVTHTDDELYEAYGKVKALKKRFHVVNPSLSLNEMQRFVRGEEQQYPCIAGYRFFFVDWMLQVWRCHAWNEPICNIYEFDRSKFVRDGCTKCMINCYRDTSLMEYIGVSVHDAYKAVRKGKFGEAKRALGQRVNADSLRSVMEEVPWLFRF